MRHVLTILIVLGVFYVGKQLYTKYESVKKQSFEAENGGPAQKPVSNLAGMPTTLESNLLAAKKQGANGLSTFLRQYRHAIQDPRLADIELDYVVLVSLQDPSEARSVFKAVQQRIPSNSPIYDRVKRLEKSYQ